MNTAIRRSQYTLLIDQGVNLQPLAQTLIPPLRAVIVLL